MKRMKFCDECGRWTLHVGDPPSCFRCIEKVDRFRAAEGLDLERNNLVSDEMRLPPQPRVFQDFDGDL